MERKNIGLGITLVTESRVRSKIVLSSVELGTYYSLPFTLPSFESAITQEDNYGVGKIKERRLLEA